MRSWAWWHRIRGHYLHRFKNNPEIAWSCLECGYVQRRGGA